MAGSLGYCGLDRRRQPLVGDEIRACWEAGAEATVIAPLAIPPAEPADRRAHAIEFVEVTDGSTLEAAPAAGEPDSLPPSPILPVNDPGWSLWGDAER